MSKKTIGNGQASLETIRKNIESTTLNSVRKVLSDKAIQDACEAAGYTYRRRLLTPIATILHMIMAAIWPEDSFAASWQLIWDTMVSRLPEAKGRGPGSASTAKARQRIPLRVWEYLFGWLSEKVQKLSHPVDSWRSHRVVLLDGTCVSTPDEKELFEAFGTGRTHGKKCKYPLIRLVTLGLAQTMTVIGYALGHYEKNETALGVPLVSMLQKGDLLVADRYFAAAHFYVKYMEQGLQFLTRVHQRIKISKVKRLWAYSETDFVGRLKIYPEYRKADPSLPQFVTVRLIQALITIRGKSERVWLATSLLDAEKYPATEIIGLYARRWRIETMLKHVKIELSADVLRSKTPEGVRKEICARLMALNIIRTIMLEAALTNGVDPLRVSFIHALRAVLAFAPALASEPAWKLPRIYDAMLAEVASHLVPYRPGRNEPRMIRRERKHYPTLKTTRAQWRLEHAA
jgi:hypothetical protein